MAHEEENGGHAAARAEATIARQARELEDLRAQLERATPAQDLRDALSVAGVAGALASPVDHAQLLRLLIETAAKVMRAESAALLLLDAEGDDLVFDVSLGLAADEVSGLRIPVGTGIAGLVAASGQPMAVARDEGEPHLAPEIEEALAFVPRSILCVPLTYNDRLLGVLEVLDKDDGSHFSTRDVETLSLFARQAAVTIAQSRMHRSIGTLLADTLEGRREPGLQEKAAALATDIEGTAAFGHARELTELLVELSTYGEDELAAGLALVRELVTYLRSRPAAGFDGEVGP